METKTKNIVIAGSFVILAILLASGLYLKNKAEKDRKMQPPEKEAVQDIELTSENEPIFQKQASEIIKTKDLSKCEEIPNEMFRKVCTNNIALNLAQDTGDVSYCKKLDNELISISDCEKKTAMESSLQKGSVESCNFLPDENDKAICLNNFYQTKSISEKNISLCDGIKEIETRNLCKDQYTYKLEFIENPKSFECEKFYTAEAKRDCVNYEDRIRIDLENDQVDPMMSVCSRFESRVFAYACLSIFNR